MPQAPTGDPSSPYISVNQAAQYLGVSPQTIYRLAWYGRVQARRFGRTWRLKREWIDAALEDPARYR